MGRLLPFLAMFACVYGVLEGLYFVLPDEFLRDVYHRCFTAVGADIVRLITPGEPVAARANILQSSAVGLEVVRGCDGAGAAFLLIAAIASYPARLSRKLLGVAAAVALAYALNEMRLVGLFYLAVGQQPWFLPVHVYLAPTLVIALSCIYFAWWTTFVPVRSDEAF